MRKLVYILPLLMCCILSCEDVIEVEIPKSEPRLIVDALIRVDTTQNIQEVRFKTSTTSGFFDELSIPASPVEQMNLLNVTSGGEPIPFIPDPAQPGTYVPEGPDGTAETGGFIATGFFTNLGDEFILSFVYEDEEYIAISTFYPTVPIDQVEQGTETLFGGDETEVKVTFTDFPEREDFYLFDMDFNEFLTTEDKFYEGQQFEFSFFYEDGLEVGDEVNISILGINRSLFNYMNQIIELSGDDGGPFQTPVSTARGNILNAEGIDNIDIFNNVDRPDSFVLGYFAIVQEFKTSLVIEDLE